MQKIILVLLFSLTFSISYSQKNDYFGSVLIPKNDYFIKPAFNGLFWKAGDKDTKIQLSETPSRFMFIPAGEGYYFIKSLVDGNYASIGNGMMIKGNRVNISEPVRDDSQKFMVISIGGNQFKLITVNKLVVESLAGEEPATRLWDDTGSAGQTYEIIESDNMKKL